MSEATTADSGVVESTEEAAVEESAQEEMSEESSGEEAVEGELEASEEVSEESEVQSDPDNQTFEVTVDGQKMQLSREELMKGFQLGAASHKRFKEAAQIKKETEASLSKLKENPLQAFLEAGGDQAALRAIAEQYLYDQISYEKMSPEEQELSDLRKYKEEQDQYRQSESDKKQEAVTAQQTAKYQEEFTKTFTEALGSAGIPATEKAIASIAKIQLDALDEGYEMPLDLAIDNYKSEQNNSITDYLSGLETDQLIKVLGKDKMKQIRKHEVAGLKNPQSRKKSASAPVSVAVEDKMSASDFFDSLKA